MSFLPPAPGSAVSGDVRVPPRPDRPARSSRPLVVGLAVSLVVALGLSALALDALLGGTSAPPTRATSASSSPEPSPSAGDEEASRPEDVGAFRFLHETSQGPVRWDPCDTITYRIASRLAPRWVRKDLARALREVTVATGIRFDLEGASTETFDHALNRIRWRGSGPDLLIMWVDSDRYEAIRHRLSSRRPSVAFAITIPGDHATRGEYVGAVLVMSESTFATGYSRGFRYRWSHGAVLLHELGHVMGLDHVLKDDEQLMYSGDSPGWDVTTFGTGDLEGLRRLGAEQGCLGVGT
jgi:hypothetical protein